MTIPLSANPNTSQILLFTHNLQTIFTNWLWVNYWWHSQRKPSNFTNLETFINPNIIISIRSLCESLHQVFRFIGVSLFLVAGSNGVWSCHAISVVRTSIWNFTLHCSLKLPSIYKPSARLPTLCDILNFTKEHEERNLSLIDRNVE